MAEEKDAVEIGLRPRTLETHHRTQVDRSSRSRTRMCSGKIALIDDLSLAVVDIATAPGMLWRAAQRKDGMGEESGRGEVGTNGRGYA